MSSSAIFLVSVVTEHALVRETASWISAEQVVDLRLCWDATSTSGSSRPVGRMHLLDGLLAYALLVIARRGRT